MDSLTRMRPAEAQQLRELGNAWESYGPALRDKLALDGGMTWKQVNCADYLCRYRQDPETGKKRFTSLGRRSRETEATYRDFIGQRDAARQTVLDSRADIALAGRVAKAHGLARMPVKSAEIVRAFWRRKLDEHLTLAGGSALFAYELGSEILGPAELLREDSLMFVTAGPLQSDLLDDVADAIRETSGGKMRVSPAEDHVSFQCGDAMEVELVSPEFFLGRADNDEQDEVLQEAFRMPRIKGVTVARDAQPVEITAFDPRAYALLAYVTGMDDETRMERAHFAATMVRECWPDKFDPRQEEAFPEVCLDPAEAGMRYGGP